MATQAQKQEFIGGLIASVLVKEGAPLIKEAVKKGLDKVADRSDNQVTQADAKAAEPVVTREVEKTVVQEAQARAEHKLDAEPHWQSRNIIGVAVGLVGELYILYTFWTDTIPQDFQADVVPHLMIIGGLLTPLYSRFIAKKPLFR